MPKSLVIVESPSKAKTINKYLGQDFIVEASMGHVCDLPKKGIAIDIDNGFVPAYEVIAGKKTVIKRLKSLAAKCDRIFLATDPDREGEAIAQHVANQVATPGKQVQRVLFNEITKTGVTAAMRAPRQIDGAMVQAQEARRVMDRLIGYKVSPFLWQTFTAGERGLSAGRVQSVALRLVVEREKEINSFIPIEYWNLLGRFATPKGDEFTARLVRYDGIMLKNPAGSSIDAQPDSTGKKSFIATKGEAEAIRERALQEQYAVRSVEKKEVRRKPLPPFITSTLQQDAGRRLKFRPKKAMELAQKLYEGVEFGKYGLMGLITYMRTDSTRISDEAAAMAEEFIFGHFGNEYLLKAERLPEKKKGKNVQDAHEAIRPADVRITPKEARKYLDKDMAALYELIWRRFVASRMADALFDQTTVEIEGGAFLFRANGRVEKFKGWLQVYSEEEDEGGSPGKEEQDDDATTPLPEGIRKGEEMALRALTAKQSHTKPPPRYTESLLVKEMEAKGIGRPSTYAAIIATIQARGYVEQKERKLYATELGMRVSDTLTANFPKLFDIAFTAKMEGDLDNIAEGKVTYLSVLQRFYRPFMDSLNAAGLLGEGNGGAGAERSTRQKRLGSGTGTRRKNEKKTDVVCGKCGSPMVLRKGKYGHYLACTGFPQCRSILPATESGAVREKKELTPGGNGAVAATGPCEKCGAPMIMRTGKNGEFYGCSAYPACRNTRAIALGVACPLCGTGNIVERIGGRYKSKFYGCSRYPECRFISSKKPVAKPCAKCGNAWLTEAYQANEGDILECPKCGTQQ